MIFTSSSEYGELIKYVLLAILVSIKLSYCCNFVYKLNSGMLEDNYKKK